jgi:hypothetical protein
MNFYNKYDTIIACLIIDIRTLVLIKVMYAYKFIPKFYVDSLNENNF